MSCGSLVLTLKTTIAAGLHQSACHSFRYGFGCLSNTGRTISSQLRNSFWILVEVVEVIEFVLKSTYPLLNHHELVLLLFSILIISRFNLNRWDVSKGLVQKLILSFLYVEGVYNFR
jgi:hypothetical protein